MIHTMIKTRFAPSPTGLMHLGNVRTALFNALFAYQTGGVFLLRIEDTDLERSKLEFTQQLLADLRWLGLLWQEGPEVGGTQSSYAQSERGDIYAKYYAELEAKNLAYPCFCSPQELAISRKIQLSSGKAPRYSGNCDHLSPTDIQRKLEQGLQPTLRFRLPRHRLIEFTDIVRGNQQFASADIGDFIIRRADGTPAFFFCNAVDDALMGVTCVLRGEDHLANTPRQILILESLNLPVPQYGHISMILGADNAPLSKRNGSLSIQELKQNGWLAEAVVNYLARLGHTFTEEIGLRPLAELAQHFSLERLGKAPAHFDMQQMQHWQQAAMNQIDTSRLWQLLDAEVHALVPSELQQEFISAVRPNLLFPKEALHWAKVLFTDELVMEDSARDTLQQAGAAFFTHAITALETSQADYKQLIQLLKESTGTKGKNLFMPLRAALTGETHGPEMAHLLSLMGVARARHRLQNAAQFC
jgi:glutamyl-tRNA synthetase